MPDDKEKQQGKLVDIDTSGPGAEVSVPEEKKIEDLDLALTPPENRSLLG